MQWFKVFQSSNVGAWAWNDVCACECAHHDHHKWQAKHARRTLDGKYESLRKLRTQRMHFIIRKKCIKNVRCAWRYASHDDAILYWITLLNVWHRSQEDTHSHCVHLERRTELYSSALFIVSSSFLFLLSHCLHLLRLLLLLLRLLNCVCCRIEAAECSRVFATFGVCAS